MAEAAAAEAGLGTKVTRASPFVDRSWSWCEDAAGSNWPGLWDGEFHALQFRIGNPAMQSSAHVQGSEAEKVVSGDKPRLWPEGHTIT